MNAENKYADYTAEDFIQDADFRDWVTSNNEITAAFWKSLMENFPHKRETVNLAYQIVEALIVEEKACSKEDYIASLNFLKEYLSGKTRQKKRSLWWSKAAAVFLLPLLMVGTYLYLGLHTGESSQMVRHIVPDGEKGKIVLNDGTAIWLNSGSTLSYESNGNLVRRVYLTGEAFFDVKKNRATPFLVETKNFTVKVYGTQFNVRAYDDMTASETILKEGIINICLENHKTIKLEPGQRFSLNKGKRVEISNVNPDLYLNWKDHILKISNETLEDLIVRMEHWYGIRITVDDFERVKRLRYTLTIKTESLREMLGLMNYVTPLSYEINGENVLLKYSER
ncbi:MAG: FecR domain-containing protein [Prolixibacteraceae bacterium]